MGKPTVGVLAIVVRGQEVLLVQRKNEPDAGLWGFPGGRLEYGETLEDGACRELLEETGVTATAQRFLAMQEVIKPPLLGQETPEFHYILVGFQCLYQAGDPVADDDALDARFVPFDVVFNEQLPLCERVAEMLRKALV